MLTLVRLYNNIKTLDEDLIIKEAFIETKEKLADVNRERMEDGIKSDGSEMPMYSYISQVVYGYPNTRIKLKATGSFQERMEIEISNDKIITDSADEKSEMLKERYGEEIFGLGNTDYKKQFIDEHLYPALMKRISKAIGLKIIKKAK